MRKIKGLRWYMIALVTLGAVLGYLTRNTVAAAAPTLMEELHISTQQYSYIIAAYSAAYTVMQPVAGYVLDVLGTKIGYAFFAIAWAVFCGSTALAGSWGGLALARGAVGAAEAAMIPAGLKASSEWFPAKERSIAVGYFNVGSSIGAMIAPPLVVWAIVMHSCGTSNTTTYVESSAGIAAGGRTGLTSVVVAICFAGRSRPGNRRRQGKPA